MLFFGNYVSVCVFFLINWILHRWLISNTCNLFPSIFKRHMLSSKIGTINICLTGSVFITLFSVILTWMLLFILLWFFSIQLYLFVFIVKTNIIRIPFKTMVSFHIKLKSKEHYYQIKLEENSAYPKGWNYLYMNTKVEHVLNMHWN